MTFKEWLRNIAAGMYTPELARLDLLRLYPSERLRLVMLLDPPEPPDYLEPEKAAALVRQFIREAEDKTRAGGS